MPGEVDLTALRLDLMDEFGLSAALPVADGQGNLTYRHWTEAPLARDGCGIPAPLDQSILSAGQLSLLLVPAMAVATTTAFAAARAGVMFPHSLCSQALA